MAKVLKSVTDTLVVHRVLEQESSTQQHNANPYGHEGLVRVVLFGVLEQMHAVGIVPAVAVEGERIDAALTEVVEAYRNGTHRHVDEMAAAWPPLFHALERLAQLHEQQNRPIADPLLDILTQPKDA